MKHFPWIFFLPVILFSGLNLYGEEIILPRTTIPYLSPTIDGKIEKGEWDKVSTILGFWGKGTKELASLQTKFYLGFDEKNIYIAFLGFQLGNVDLKRLADFLRKKGEKYSQVIGWSQIAKHS